MQSTVHSSFCVLRFFSCSQVIDQSQGILSRFRYEGMRVFCCDNCQNRIFEIDSLLVNHRHIKLSPLSLPLFMGQYSNLTINKLQKVKAIRLLFSYYITLVLILQQFCILHQKQFVNPSAFNHFTFFSCMFCKRP